MDPAAMQGLIDQQLANTLLAVEGALDAELEKTENLDEDDLARIKANRMAEMKKKAEQTEMNRHNGKEGRSSPRKKNALGIPRS